METLQKNNINTVIEIQVLKEISEMYKEKFKKLHIERLKEEKC